LDVVWGGGSAGSKDEEVDGSGDRSTGKGNIGGECGHPIVTNGDFVALSVVDKLFVISAK